VEGATLHIVMEYVEGGNLHDHIRRNGPGQGLPEPDVWRALLSGLVALTHLHTRRERVIHRDVKSLNLMLADKGSLAGGVKVGDFGIARVLSRDTHFAKTRLGTPLYISPEVCEDKPYNEKSDIWSLGVVLYEMMTGR